MRSGMQLRMIGEQGAYVTAKSICGK